MQHGLLSVKEANDWLAQNKCAAFSAGIAFMQVLALTTIDLASNLQGVL